MQINSNSLQSSTDKDRIALVKKQFGDLKVNSHNSGNMIILRGQKHSVKKTVYSINDAGKTRYSPTEEYVFMYFPP